MDAATCRLDEPPGLARWFSAEDRRAEPTGSYGNPRPLERTNGAASFDLLVQPAIVGRTHDADPDGKDHDAATAAIPKLAGVASPCATRVKDPP